MFNWFKKKNKRTDFSASLAARLKEQHFETQIRFLTSEDNDVCAICEAADHMLSTDKIIASEGGWTGQTWGDRFGSPPFHEGCRCKTVVERRN